MDIKKILFRFNPWWEEDFTAPGIYREIYLNQIMNETKEKRITVITGLRRVGKTTLIKQAIAKLIKETDKKYIFFVSLDHSALVSINLLDIVEKYREIHGISYKEKIFLFFDEIQHHKEFERDLKILHDHENVKIFASGSNSLILKDKKAFLTGRNKNIIISPLTFEEYLKFNSIKISSADKQIAKNHFEKYLEYGGMPEYVLTKDTEKIISLVDDIIYKDIMSMHKIKNVTKIKELFLLLCERVGKRLTYNKLANILGIDAETVSSYMSYFEECFLIYQVNRHAKSLNETVKSPKKIYIADNGIRSVFVGFKDKGALMENLVFLKLKEKKVSYFSEKEKEIDFIMENSKKKEKIAIEVKYKKNIEEKELEFFEKSGFKKKILIKDFNDFDKLMIE